MLSLSIGLFPIQQKPLHLLFHRRAIFLKWGGGGRLTPPKKFPDQDREPNRASLSFSFPLPLPILSIPHAQTKIGELCWRLCGGGVGSCWGFRGPRPPVGGGGSSPPGPLFVDARTVCGRLGVARLCCISFLRTEGCVLAPALCHAMCAGGGVPQLRRFPKANVRPRRG